MWIPFYSQEIWRDSPIFGRFTGPCCTASERSNFECVYIKIIMNLSGRLSCDSSHVQILMLEKNNSVSETSNPVSETSNPVSKTSNPVSETSNPASETSNPLSETSNPLSETSNPVSETSDGFKPFDATDFTDVSVKRHKFTFRNLWTAHPQTCGDQQNTTSVHSASGLLAVHLQCTAQAERRQAMYVCTSISQH